MHIWKHDVPDAVGFFQPTHREVSVLCGLQLICRPPLWAWSLIVLLASFLAKVLAFSSG